MEKGGISGDVGRESLNGAREIAGERTRCACEYVQRSGGKGAAISQSGASFQHMRAGRAA
eukprot:scaffold25193_cov29-Tisochrysis_lutea.AAC.3